jgi:hypothetical protein
VILVRLGQDVHITGGGLYAAIERGLKKGYADGYLRKSMVQHPFSSRTNTKTNCPAVIHTEIVSGDKLTIILMPKGGGSENMSRLAMLSPAQGQRGVVDFVVKAVDEAGSNPCPPVIVGVGIGGTAEKASLLAKEALLRPLALMTLGARVGAAAAHEARGVAPAQTVRVADIAGRPRELAPARISPGEVREFVAGGAEFLVNITNDAWFGRSGAPYQHLAMAAMRAVENGVFLVRAANTGVTAVVAPTGEILAETPLFTRAAITGSIRLRQGMTPYTRYGDVFAWTCLLFLLGYALRLGVACRRGRSATRMPGEIPSREPPTMSHES